MTPRGRPTLPWVLLAFALLVVPAILAGGGGTSQAADFREYHLLEIRRLSAGWPGPDLRDSLSSTTPGFHLVLSVADRLGAGVTSIRLLGSLAGLAAWLVAWRVACRWMPVHTAALTAAPLALSPYLVASSVWCTTEAAAVALASATMGMALLLRPSATVAATLGVLGAATVLVRQILVWACVPALLAMLFGDSAACRRRRLAWALVTVAPATACVTAFLVIWGGPVPPRFLAFHQSMGNPAAPVVVLAVFGVWGGLLLPGLWRSAEPGPRRLALLASVIAVLLGATVETGYRKVLPPEAQRAGTGFEKTGRVLPADVVVGGHELGRWGGPLWDTARSLPTVQGRSVAVVGSAAVGGAVLALLWSAAQLRGRGRQAAWLLAAVAGLAVTQSANAQTFQRYFDPWVLLVIGWLVAMGWSSSSRGSGWLRAGLTALALVQLAMTAAGVLMPAMRGPPLLG